MTPEEAFFGKKPDVGHFRIFGCLTYSYVPKGKRTKLETTAHNSIFVGYRETSKAYRIYRRSRKLQCVESPDTQQQLSQSQGSSAHGARGQGSRSTSTTVIGPSVSSGSQSQVSGSSGSL